MHTIWRARKFRMLSSDMNNTILIESFRNLAGSGHLDPHCLFEIRLHLRAASTFHVIPFQESNFV
jgi:hypothetical protein